MPSGHRFPFRRAWLCGALFLLVGACGTERSSPREAQPILPQETRVMQSMSPEKMRALTGVDRMPMPADREAFAASMARHTPPGLSKSGSVLVDVQIDAEGTVQGVELPTPPSPGANHRAVLVERDPVSGRETERPMEASDHNPVLGAAARAALRDIRFTPATRDGRPVAYTLRMTVGFSPPPTR